MPYYEVGAMKSIKEIFGDNINRVILFEDNEWCIYRGSVTYPMKKYLSYSCILHRCDGSIDAQADDVIRCKFCMEPIPDSIKTMLVLYRWDR
ncbi:hypothetical protein LCGC14_2695790 [marine sediment metagenome]|uniref:Uncharacterized protein n=1 Tax=marine sediment metagenome TaxID=412755 RepID=A0A0F8ZH41_9ZZZZ